jgi:phage shock protein A
MTKKNKESQAMSSITAPLLKTIEVQDKLIKNLENEVVRLNAKVKEWEEAIAKNKANHAKGKAKAEQAISKNKQKLGFLKKHKPKK